MNKKFKIGVYFFTIAIVILMVCDLALNIPTELFGIISSILIICDAVCYFLYKKNASEKSDEQVDKLNKSLKIIICIIIAISLAIPYHSTVLADSYVEKVNKNDWKFKTYAPYSQTKTYRIWYKTTESIDKVIYKNKRAKKFVNGKLFSYTGDLMTVGGGVATKFGCAFAATATMKIGIVLVGAKYTTILIANRDIKYLNSIAKGRIKKDLKCVTQVKFKWTNPDKFKYKVVVESYITYRGKKVGNLRTSTTTGTMF